MQVQQLDSQKPIDRCTTLSITPLTTAIDGVGEIENEADPK